MSDENDTTAAEARLAAAERELAELRQSQEVLTERLARLELEQERLKLSFRQQRAQLRDVGRLVEEIRHSRIWKTLVGVGGAMLSAAAIPDRLARRVRNRAAGAAIRIECGQPAPQSWVSGRFSVQGEVVGKAELREVEVRLGDQRPVSAALGEAGRGRAGGTVFRAALDSGAKAGPESIRVRATDTAGRWAESRIAVRVARAEAVEQAAVEGGPLISVLTPVFNTPERWLRLCVQSVMRQSYGKWEMCLADDGSTEPHVRSVLDELAAAEPRVRVTYRASRGHIAEATNTALATARGEWVVLLDHDDELAEDALEEVARAAAASPAADLIYSDEDKIGEDGVCHEPFYKPDWSPEQLLSYMYTCHLSAFRTTAVREAGGFRTGFDGSQDYDVTLRVSSRAREIVHIPKVLYHWRAAEGSTASDLFAKTYAQEAAARALECFVSSGGENADVLPGARPGLFRVRFAVRGTPKVSIVIPTAAPVIRRGEGTVDVLSNCLRSIRQKTTWGHYEIVVVLNGSLTGEQREAVRTAGAMLIEDSPSVLNLAAKMNLGAQRCSGEYLVFLNDDTEVLSPGWLESMLEHGQRKGVGAVGARLLFPEGTIQHAGVLLLAGVPSHPYHGCPAGEPGYYHSAEIVRNYLAVTGACLMTPAGVFREAGGFDPAFRINFNDIDYCLRLREQGYRTVYTPHAELYHYESVSLRSQARLDLGELALFQERWLEKYYLDPFYNPNLPTERPYVGFLNTAPERRDAGTIGRSA